MGVIETVHLDCSMVLPIVRKSWMLELDPRLIVGAPTCQHVMRMSQAAAF